MGKKTKKEPGSRLGYCNRVLIGNISEFCFITLSSFEFLIKDFIALQGVGLFLGVFTIFAHIYSGCLTYYFDTERDEKRKPLSGRQKSLFTLVTIVFGFVAVASMIAGSLITYTVLSNFLPWAIPNMVLVGMGIFAAAVYFVQGVSRTLLNALVVYYGKQEEGEGEKQKVVKIEKKSYPKRLKERCNSLFTKSGRVGLILRAVTSFILFAATFQLPGIIVGVFAVAVDAYCTEIYFKYIDKKYGDGTGFVPKDPKRFSIKYGLASVLYIVYNGCVVFSSLWYFTLAISLPISPVLIASFCGLTALSGVIAGSIRSHKTYQVIMKKTESVSVTEAETYTQTTESILQSLPIIAEELGVGLVDDGTPTVVTRSSVITDDKLGVDGVALTGGSFS